MTSNTTKAAPLVPLSKRPEYLAVVAEHNELAAAAAKVETRIREIELMLNSEVDSLAVKDAARVENALHYAATGEVKGLSNDPTVLREEHVLLREQRDAIKKAMHVKHDTIFNIERRLSHEVSAEVHGAFACAGLAWSRRESARRGGPAPAPRCYATTNSERQLMTNTTPPSREQLTGSIPDDDEPFYGPDGEPFQQPAQPAPGEKEKP